MIIFIVDYLKNLPPVAEHFYLADAILMALHGWLIKSQRSPYEVKILMINHPVRLVHLHTGWSSELPQKILSVYHPHSPTEKTEMWRGGKSLGQSPGRPSCPHTDAQQLSLVLEGGLCGQSSYESTQMVPWLGHWGGKERLTHLLGKSFLPVLLAVKALVPLCRGPFFPSHPSIKFKLTPFIVGHSTQ